jgi:predicted Zn-dependent protease
MRLFRVTLAGTLAAVFVSVSALGQSLLRDEETERMLHTFADPIFAAAGLNPKDVKLYVIGDPTLNAGAFGGQNIEFNTGIIVGAQEPIELKGVIAHETGHLTGAHIARSGEMGRAGMGPFLATMAASIAAAAAGRGDAAAVLMMNSQYFGALGELKYSREQETRADLAAVGFLEKTGQSGRGLISFFSRFRSMEIFADAQRYPYFTNHPLSSERIENLQERVDAQPHRDAKDPHEQQVMLDHVKAKIYGFLDTPETTFRRFPEDQQHTEAIYARSIAHYRAGDLNKAMAGIAELLKREPNNPYFWELKGQVYYEHGQAKLAVDPYQHAVKLLPDSALLRIGLAQSLIDLNDDSRLDEAMKQLTVALAIEPDNSFAWYERSRIHERRGEHGEALLATAERSYYGGDLVRAFQFAQQARRALKEDSPEWLQAGDIVSTVAASKEFRQQQQQQQGQGQGQGRRRGP